MKKYFESFDGGSIVPFSQVVKVEKFGSSECVSVYYPSQFSNNICCSVSQLTDYLYWVENKDSVRAPNE